MAVILNPLVQHMVRWRVPRVLAAFSALSQAVKGIDLSDAYALWGGFGIAATLAAGWILFGQRLNRKG
ncbi:SMR family transporter, partial [Escherichia coli]|uniref:SMR family transporter n=1 Tax=Escherichia coli TaxID=562 RepID=UPI00201A492C